MTIYRILTLIACLFAPTVVRADYQPKAEPVADNVYAIVGPLGQRSQQNDRLNANYERGGFKALTSQWQSQQ